MIAVSLNPVRSLWPRSFFNVMAYLEKKKPRRLFSVEAMYKYVAGCNDDARRAD
jgi:hypothetical protein